MASKPFDQSSTVNHHADSVECLDDRPPIESTRDSQKTTDDHEQHVPRPQDITIIQALDLEEAAPVRTKLRLGAILLALYLSLFIAALDQTIIATSVPVITASFKDSGSGYFWIGAAYLLATAAAGPIWAKCSDIWGRKPALLAAVVLFAAASIMAALSVSIGMLIAARALQGTAGGGLLGLVAVTIADMFSVRRRTLFTSTLEVVWALAAGLGPIIGGAFTQLVSWRWCFWINLFPCGISFVLLLLFLNVHNPRTGLREGIAAIDWFGTFSILGVILMLLLGLDFGGAIFPWSSPKVICLIVFGIVMIGIFLFSEKRLAKYPLMPLSMFGDWTNNAVFAAAFCHGMSFIAAEYYIPLYLQSVKGVSPLRSGVLILPLDISEAIPGILAGVCMHLTGRFREIIWIGMAFLTLGTGLYINLDRGSSVAEIAGFEILEGMGSGLLFEAPIIAIQAAVSQADTATATATMGLIRNIAASMGLVLGGVVFENSIDARLGDLKAAGLNSTLISAFSHGKAAANFGMIRTICDESQRQAVEDVFASSLRNIWIMFTCIAGAGLIFSAFIAHKHMSEEHTETRTGIEKMTQRLENA